MFKVVYISLVVRALEVPHLSGSPADAGQEFLEVPQKKPL